MNADAGLGWFLTERLKKERTEMTEQGKKEPVQKIRRGSVEAALWENETRGKVWHNVSIYRCFKSENGDFREAPTYALSDLVQVGRVAQLAEDWISHRLSELAASKKTANS
jgi:hypothetical protein